MTGADRFLLLAVDRRLVKSLSCIFLNKTEQCMSFINIFKFYKNREYELTFTSSKASRSYTFLGQKHMECLQKWFFEIYVHSYQIIWKMSLSC